MKILFLSHTAIGGTFVVGSHHLAREMAKLGHDVLHLSPPVTPAHISLIKNSFERERFVRWWKKGKSFESVQDVIPFSLLPWGIAKKLGKPFFVFGKLFSLSALKLLHKYNFLQPDLVLIDEPRLGFLLDSFKNSRIVYRPTDVYSEIRNDISLLDAEIEVIKRSHVFLATSEPVAEHLNKLGVRDVLVVENGVDLDHFINGIDFDVESKLPSKPRAIYAGAMDHRFGTDSLIEAATLNPNVSFVIIGPLTNELVKKQFINISNIFLFGSIEYKYLPSYFRRCQIGLLPLSNEPSNQGRSPMKLFEYAAAGLPVVATNTKELERRNNNFVKLAKSKNEFAIHIKQLILDDTLNKELIIKNAEMQGWAAKCQIILHYVSNSHYEK